jgi:hypothetical protein
MFANDARKSQGFSRLPERCWQNSTRGSDRHGTSGESRYDLLAVKSAVFDEDLTGEIAANYDACKKNARHIAFQRLRIQRGLASPRIDFDPSSTQKGEIRVITGEDKDLTGG